MVFDTLHTDALLITNSLIVSLKTKYEYNIVLSYDDWVKTNRLLKTVGKV